MTDEKRLIARARDYMRELAEGRDPLTGRTPEGDSVLDEPRMRRCFAFVATYLQRELERASATDELYLPTEAEAKLICSEEDVSAAEFYERLAARASVVGQTPVSSREINHFLLRSALVTGHVESVFVERRVLRATERGKELGIYDKPRLSPRTGALTQTLMLTPEAQHWLLGMLPALASEEPDEKEES